MLDALEVRYGIRADELESSYTLQQIELKYHFLGRAKIRHDLAEKDNRMIATLEALGHAFGGKK